MIYVIKTMPRDFIVEEVLPDGIVQEQGGYLVFLVEKQGRNTEDVLQDIASALGVQRKHLGFCGSKDRQAVARQYVSIAKRPSLQPERCVQRISRVPGVKVWFKGYSAKPLSLGDLAGNRFSIVVRNLDSSFDFKNFQRRVIQAIVAVPNYFDEQRFSEKNAEVGRLLVKRRFREAVELITAAGRGSQEQAVLEFLQDPRHRNNWVGALQAIPKKTLQLYIHAYQSFLFNQALATCLKKSLKKTEIVEVEYSLGRFLFIKKLTAKREMEIKGLLGSQALPLIGFSIDWERTGISVKRIIEGIMKSEEVTERDFIIREMPYLTSEGGSRKGFMEVRDFTVAGFGDDDLHPGKRKLTISFSLGKGSYATILVKQLFSGICQAGTWTTS